MLGIATIFIWQFVETGTRRSFLAASGALALCACTRSISIFYMIGALSALSAVLSFYRLFIPSAISLQNLSKRSLQMTGASFAVLCLFLQNAFHLYGWLLGTAALIAVCMQGLTLSGHQRNNSRPWLLLVSTACLAASAFFLINFYTPSYHGMGVITVPLVCCLVGWLNSIGAFTDRRIWLPGVIALTSGLFCFGWQMTHPAPKLLPFMLTKTC